MKVVWLAFIALLSIVSPLNAGQITPSGVLDVNDIQRMIDTKMSHWSRDDIWKGTMWMDRWYRKTTVPEMVEYTKRATKAAKQLPWYGEAGDCDDAALIFKSVLVRQAMKNKGENPIPAGIIIMTDDHRTDVHAMIWFVDDEMEMWLIEPRGGWMQHWKEFPGLRVVWIMG